MHLQRLEGFVSPAATEREKEKKTYTPNRIRRMQARTDSKTKKNEMQQNISTKCRTDVDGPKKKEKKERSG
jgi:hypothetical protein